MLTVNNKIKDIGEFGLINSLSRMIKVSNNVVCGINDDAAVLRYTKDKYLLFTTDMLIEGVHFTKSMPPEAIGRKALAVNVSDIAAMGGLPLHAVVSLGLPPDLKIAFIKKIYKGISRLAKEFNINIVGGDTDRSKSIVINIALLGEVEKKHLVLRSTAKAGDFIFVSGSLGKSFDSGKHLNFIPRIELARYLVKKYKPSSMIDISDGLVLDLSHILELSNLGAVIYEQLVPRNRNATLKEALYEGEDFELLFTMKRREALLFLKSLEKIKYKVPVSFIGKITSQRGKISLAGRFNKIRTLAKKGFTHF